VKEESTKLNEMVWVLWVLPAWSLAPRGQDSSSPFPSIACVDPSLLKSLLSYTLVVALPHQGAAQASSSSCEKAAAYLNNRKKNSPQVNSSLCFFILHTSFLFLLTKHLKISVWEPNCT